MKGREREGLVQGTEWCKVKGWRGNGAERGREEEGKWSEERGQRE